MNPLNIFALNFFKTHYILILVFFHLDNPKQSVLFCISDPIFVHEFLIFFHLSCSLTSISVCLFTLIIFAKNTDYKALIVLLEDEQYVFTETIESNWPQNHFIYNWTSISEHKQRHVWYNHSLIRIKSESSLRGLWIYCCVLSATHPRFQTLFQKPHN